MVVYTSTDGDKDPYRFIYDHQDINDAIAYYIKDHPRLQEIDTITTQPLNIYSSGNLHLPVVSIFTVSNIRSDRSTTELAGYVLDDSGGQIGEIYETVFDMTIQLDIWAMSQSGNNPGKIGSKLEIELLRFDSQNKNDYLPDPDEEGGYISNISYFTVQSGNRLDFNNYSNVDNDNILKRWMMEIDIGFFYRINTVDLYGANKYLTKINYPEYGDFQKSPRPEIEIEADPTL